MSILAALLVITAMPWSAAGATAGPEFGTGSDGGGGVAWTNPGNVNANDNANATRSLTQNQTSSTLWAKSMGFSIPSGATIKGIQVSIGRYYGSSSGGTQVRDNTVQLTKDGSAFVGDNNANTGSNWPTSEGAASYGGTSNLWGATWTPAEINSANFGVGLRATNFSSTTRTAYVDYMTITVTYTEAGGPAMAQTAVNENPGGGAAAWSNPGNVGADDGTAATASVNQNSTSQYLNATNFGFNIPAEATINGVTVRIDRQTSGTTSPLIRDHTVELLKSGSRSGDNKAVTDTNWPGTYAVATYGSTSDMWGTTLTPSDVNASDFGVSLRVSNTNGSSSRTASVDFIEITVDYDLDPRVTVEQAAGQDDPTNVASINYDVTFNKDVTGVEADDFVVGGSATGFAVDSVTGSGSSYSVAVTGTVDATDGTVTLSMPAGGAQDSGARTNRASTSVDNVVTYDTVRPTVTVEQAAGQDDPTNVASIDFDVEFDEPVFGLEAEDFVVGGSATGFAVDSVSGSGATYSVTVTGTVDATDGTVTLSLPADSATDAAGNGNEAGTSVDYTVTYDTYPPTTWTTIDPEDPDGDNGWYVTAPTVTFSTEMGATTWYKWDDAATYTSYTLFPTVIAPEGEHTLYVYSEDAAGNEESVRDIDFKVDTTAPAVTVDQAAGQDDPTNVASIDFDVVFDEDVTGLTGDDFTVGGTATGFDTVDVTGSGDTYVATVSGTTPTDGTVTLALAADKVDDIAGNTNEASNSTDNSVTFDTTAPAVTVDQAAGQDDPTNVASIDFDVVFDEDVTGLTGDDFTVGGTAIGFDTVDVTGSGDTYVATVSGATPGDGTVTLALAAGKGADAAGNTNEASTSTDNSVTYDGTTPVTTWDADIDPNAGGWYATAPKITLECDDATADVYYKWSTGSYALYSAPIDAAEGTDTLYFYAEDPAGNVESENSQEFKVDSVKPSGTVEINSDDPETASADVTLDLGASDPAPASGVEKMRFSNDGTDWSEWEDYGTTASWTLASRDGTKTVHTQFKDAADNVSDAATDQIVLDAEIPSVTVEQAADQDDPTNVASIDFDVEFSEEVVGLTNDDFVVDGTATGFDTVDVSGSGDTYVVTVSGNTVSDGTVTLSLPAATVVDISGNDNTESTSTDNEVTYDGTAPTVTVEQAAAQADPTKVASIDFDVVFDENVTGLAAGDFTVGGTATGFSVSSVSGSGDTYAVTVSGAAVTDGVITLALDAGAAADAAGNPNEASTSTDNEVTYDNSAPTVTGLAVTTYTQSSVSLKWDVMDDQPSGTKHYNVWRTGVTPVAITGTEYTFDGLLPSTAYTFFVQTVDELDNESTPAQVSKTTPATTTEADVAVGSPTVELGTADGPVKVKFDNVTVGGKFYLTPEPNPPAGYRSGTTYIRVGNLSYELHFTGSFTGQLTITMPYSPLLPDSRAAAIKVRHLATGGWETVTPSVDPVNHTITFKLTSLSPIVVAEPTNASKALSLTTNFGGQKSTVRTFKPAYGSAVSLVATLKDAGGKGVDNKKVTLQKYSGGKWVNVVQVSRTAKGVYTYKTTAKSKVLYRFVVAGDAYTNAATGLSYTLYPKVKLSITKAPTSAKVGKSFTIKGKLTPKHKAGTKLTLKFYKYSKGKYVYQYAKTVKVKTSGSSSVFSNKFTIKKAGTWRVRIYAKTDSLHSASYSAYKKIKVKK